VELNETAKTAKVEVGADQLSLAIGRGGQNVRLAVKLTGWKIDILGAEVKAVEGSELPEGEVATETTGELVESEVKIDEAVAQSAEVVEEAPVEVKEEKSVEVIDN
jgi:N utilization substance protein A